MTKILLVTVLKKNLCFWYLYNTCCLSSLAKCLHVCDINSPLWERGCSGGTDSSNGGGGTSRLLGVQARLCDERFCCLWIQASMIVL